VEHPVEGIRGQEMWTAGRADSVVDPQARLDDMVAKLQQNGYRLTPQRLTVLKILAASDQHPSVEQIYARVKPDFPMTSLATVYKTVTLLKEMGEVLELSFGGYSNRYDGKRPYPHPHLLCIKCKDIVDSDVPAFSELAEEITQKTGYQIVSHRLEFFGICPRCQDKE
jgi:Fur family peroxide stress response transcriptional regulator